MLIYGKKITKQKTKAPAENSNASKSGACMQTI